MLLSTLKPVPEGGLSL